MRSTKIASRQVRLRSVVRNRIDTSSAPSTAIAYSRRLNDDASTTSTAYERGRAPPSSSRSASSSPSTSPAARNVSVGVTGRVGDVRDAAGDEAEHAYERDPAASSHRVPSEPRGMSSRITLLLLGSLRPAEKG